MKVVVYYEYTIWDCEYTLLFGKNDKVINRKFGSVTSSVFSIFHTTVDET